MSSIYTSTYGQLVLEFHSSRLVATLGLSLFVAGLGLGPMILSPLSEVRVTDVLTACICISCLLMAELVLRPPAYLHRLLQLLSDLADPLRRRAKHGHHPRGPLPRWPFRIGLPERGWWNRRRLLRAARALSPNDDLHSVAVHWVSLSLP